MKRLGNFIMDFQILQNIFIVIVCMICQVFRIFIYVCVCLMEAVEGRLSEDIGCGLGFSNLQLICRNLMIRASQASGGWGADARAGIGMWWKGFL